MRNMTQTCLVQLCLSQSASVAGVVQLEMLIKRLLIHVAFARAVYRTLRSEMGERTEIARGVDHCSDFGKVQNARVYFIIMVKEIRSQGHAKTSPLRVLCSRRLEFG